MKAKEKRADLPEKAFASGALWDAWLRRNHELSHGVWLRIAKKGSGIPSVTYAEALDVALCHGWIDGQKRPKDARSWLQRFTPRGPRSPWSQRNRDRVERLTAEGRMRPAGRAEVEKARADGRWHRAYASQANAAVPEDLAAALRKDAGARAFFATLSSVNRYAILYRLQTAKKPETRARRLELFLQMLREKKTLH